MCPAPLGNRFWEARSTHGRKPVFESPDKLWEACIEYFNWVEDNPLYESKLVSFQGISTIEELPKMRAMTIMGLCLFLDISQTTWDNYRAKEDFVGITTRADDVIRKQKLEGAAADLLNANIIAREIGLKDTTAHEHSGPGGGPIETAKVLRVRSRKPKK